MTPPLKEISLRFKKLYSLLVDLHGRGIGLLVLYEGKGIGLVVVLDRKGIRILVDLRGRE